MLVGLLFSCIVAGLICDGLTTTITVRNNCPYPLWIATLTGSGGQVDPTGFLLNAGDLLDYNVPNDWAAGRIWARTQCDSGPTCVTGDCGSGAGPCDGKTGAPPATLAEFTLVPGGQDNYDISLVDGFNVPARILPLGGSGPKCEEASCPNDLNGDCPDAQVVRNSEGVNVGCKSGCAAFGNPEYCCTGDHDRAETCPISGNPPAQRFKDRCPQAYSYAYDDPDALKACSGSPNYDLTFCP